MFKAWEVTVKSGCDTLMFSFETSEEAAMFAKMALLSVQKSAYNSENSTKATVKISASADKEYKEDKENGMELSEG